MKNFYLIDGSGFLYRAYYAFPSMPDKNGENVNVVYGFFRMIMKLFFDKPDYFMIAWDAHTKTHRHEAYPEYKANRTKAPDDFKRQIPIVQEISKKLGIPNLVLPGYEADDIIASIIKRFSEDKNIICNVFSADKDLKQLLDENIIFTDPTKGITYKTNDFIQEYGFEPKYILDYLALIGDSADNIKGVPGIGPKGASALIQKYQTIENIYQNLDEIGGATKEKLQEGIEFANHAKGLITLEYAPEIEIFEIDDFKLDINFKNFEDVLIRENNFGSLSKAINELKNKYLMPQQSSLF